jgi:type I site-specific restriction-modification system R (restriction) subunit
MYGLFLLYGVEGMPTPPMMPKNTKDIDKLHGYGQEFGKKAYNFALRLFRADSMRVDRASETLSLTFMKLFSDPTLKGKLAGKPLAYAENYALSAVRSEAVGTMRKEKVREHSNIEDLVHEPASWDNLADMIPRAEQEELLKELERSVNSETFPDIVEYFQLLLEGHNTQEIARERLLPSLQKREQPMSQQGLRRYEDVIKRVLENHFGV